MIDILINLSLIETYIKESKSKQEMIKHAIINK